MKIAFIGCGNMASAIIGGLLKKKTCGAKDITATAKTQKSLERAEENFGIRTISDNQKACEGADIVVLAVKPQMFGEVLPEIAGSLTEKQIILSIAAGRTLDTLEGFLGSDKKIVRAMPNTPAMVGEGITGFCVNSHVKAADKKTVLSILNSFGEAEEVPEKLMDVVGSVSGCSPAFVYLFIEAMADAAVADGMPRKMALHFASQAVLGSAKMVLATGQHPGELKDAVCSPGGSTIEGVQVLEEDGFAGTVMDALRACTEKSRKM
ncbi:MAG: pyrroline-5-carboxylate reductase [Lachnospiraceae bacterium]|nr:pyrroline-5-carboxylate reductase [Lachnospiraceae bacterium]MCI1727188.1 pyrroline-5-carboxylate reductase [Lachnospiraceae bacterium]